jgi:hypothetical protein
MIRSLAGAVRVAVAAPPRIGSQYVSLNVAERRPV